MTAADQPRSRSSPLDGVRGLAAFGVLILHCWLYTTTDAQKADSLQDAVVHQLRLAVPLFFCLSGFLLYRAWAGAALDGRPLPDAVAFLRRRALRILPAYWLCLLATIALLAPLGATRGVDVPGPGLLVLFAVFAQNLHPATAGALDPPMWTLAVEVQFYVLLPLLGAAGVFVARGRPGAQRMAALLAVPALLVAGSMGFNVWLAARPGSLVAASSVLVAAPAFACGMAVAVLLHGRRVPSPLAWALVLAGMALVIGDGAWHESSESGPVLIWRDLPADTGFALVIAGLWNVRARVLSSRPLLWLGSISFGVYLWHMPLMLFARGAGVFPEHRPLLSVVVVSALTLPVAWASWVLVERPALRGGALLRQAPQPA